jgi:hypothetical protein
MRPMQEAMAEPTTTIRVTHSVRDELLARGRMGESYSDVIRRLLSESPAQGGPIRHLTPGIRSPLYVRPEP